MSEYNYNYNNNGTEENGNNYNGFSTDGGNNNKPPKKRTGLKAAAFIMAMAIVSGGSIQAYRYFSDDSVSTVSVVEDNDKDEKTDSSNTAKTKLAAQNISIIEPVESDGKALSTEEIVKKVLPSVVGIESSFELETQVQSSIPNEFFDFGFGGFGGFDGFDYGGGQSEPQTREYKGTGTGVVVSENGYIVTNAHVIYDSEYGAGCAKGIKILLDDDETYDAEVIGYDVALDLAVLKIDATGLTPAEFGNSDELQLGESVIAIGNPLGFELKNTVTGGMISGLDRDITINDKAMNLIQTDAAINSGNSGGPLINKYGQVIGINSSKMSSSYSSSGASIEGIGFAIPSNATASIIDDLMKFGYVTGKPQLGISCRGIDETAADMYNLPVGVLVKEVNEGSAADKAGIKVGDIIIKADGEKVTTSDELVAKKNKHSAGDEFELTLLRNGVEKTIVVTLDEQVQETPAEEKDNDEKEEKNSKKNDEAEDEDEEPATKSKKSERTHKAPEDEEIFD
ncbi:MULTISPECIES: S1C family serine protease [Ruminococcus]|uniref:Serine protease Do n=1 Tax=Ruminococcus flavefaciens TaxID=1265 RepID=A0A1M7J2S3_RUMFL|nr:MULTISPECIES: trypsin-like peptidase domain-containing protein [Ruminococcus]MCR4796236.1 trypsin-like peptidase domain-containing protein [Ruminococcus sp.]SHM47286.1 serine protease Do [Ruminococcus flavefaciens]